MSDNRSKSTRRTRKPPPEQGGGLRENSVRPDGATTEPTLAWRPVDLHLHTPASKDYQEPSVTPLDILRQAEARGLKIIAFTDHNSVRGYADLWREIEDLELLEYLKRLNDDERARLIEYRRLLATILLLPGFEFTATFGFHILAIFPEGTTVRLMEHLLLLLGVPEERFGSGEVGATTDVLRAYEILDEHGAIVIGAHANSTHGVAMQGLGFGGQTKIAYTQDKHLHALEATDLHLPRHRRSTARFFNGTKAEYPRRMHCIQGSDAHRIERDPNRESNLGIGDRATEMLLPAPSFQAVKDLFFSDDFSRTRQYIPIVDPADEVKAAREDGNTASQVFHERLATKRDGSGHVLRDLVAFANTEGGAIYVGISPNGRRSIAGVPDAERATAELQREIHKAISPPIDIEIEAIPSDDRTILALRVPAGDNRPYAHASGMIYVRDGAASRIASRDEIVEMVQSATPRTRPAPRPTAQPDPPRLPTLPDDPSVTRAAEPPSPQPVDRQRRGRRRRRGGASAPAAGEVASPASSNGHEEPSSARAPSAPPVQPADPSPMTTKPRSPDTTEWTEDDKTDNIAPGSGVEILSSSAVEGVILYSIRDLRNAKIVHNVRRDTTRRIWRYAIEQHEEKPLDERRVRWSGDFGFWKTYTPRGGDRRINLVHRGDDGPRIFYAVSEDGLEDRWRAVLPTRRRRTATTT